VFLILGCAAVLSGGAVMYAIEPVAENGDGDWVGTSNRSFSQSVRARRVRDKSVVYFVFIINNSNNNHLV